MRGENPAFLPERPGKQFFFEKKNQKNFCSWGPMSWTKPSGNKSFFAAFFSKKAVLA
jgi:hypothetical protein